MKSDFGMLSIVKMFLLLLLNFILFACDVLNNAFNRYLCCKNKNFVALQLGHIL